METMKHTDYMDSHFTAEYLQIPLDKYTGLHQQYAFVLDRGPRGSYEDYGLEDLLLYYYEPDVDL